MSDHEVFKLKKELVQCRKLLEQQKTELKVKDTRIIDLEEEADFQKGEAEGLRLQVRQIFEQLQEKERIIMEDDPNLKEQLKKDIREKENLLQSEIAQQRELKNQLDIKETLLANLRMQLREAAIKYKDDTILQDAENYRDEVLANRMKVQNLVEKSNQMSQALEQLSAENRVLRKMAGVPDDYQFELNDIIQEGQLQVEKYRAQVRALEEEVEELEEERARLRRRLRENVVGNELGGENEEDLQSRKAIKQELQDLKQKCKQYEEEIYQYKLDGQVHIGGRTQGFDHGANEGIEELMKQNNELKDQFSELIKQLQTGQQQPFEQTQFSQLGQTGQPAKSQIKMGGTLQQLALPPTPIPGAFGNYNDIKDGYSQRFSSKLPVDLSNVQGDSGMDQMQIKYEIASLQLQNIETLHLLQEKEKEYYSLQNEVEEIKEDLRTKCLLVQDELFQRYHNDKTEWTRCFGELEVKYKVSEDMVKEYKVKIDQYQSFLVEVQKKSTSSLENKFAEMIKRTAIQDVNFIKLSRKYEALTEEYKQIKTSFINQQSDYIEKEKDLLEKVCKLVHWKRTSSAQMKIMLHQLQQSVPKETFHIIRQQLEYTQDKLANASLKESEYIKKISFLESAERELYEKAERIRNLEEELIEVQLEEEVVKKRLETLDPYFRKFQLVYTQMVDFIKIRNISPLQMFQMFDENGDGHISKNEFQTAVRNMGIPIQPEEMEVLYMFVDLDGTGEIEYQEFIRRLRRSGVNIRKKEDELLFTLYRAIQDAGLQLRSAFEAFDTNGDNIISKADMKEVLTEMRIAFQPEAIDYIFKIADTSGDNQISYDEFSNLFEGIIKNQLQENSRMVVGELDWKMQVMLKLDAAVKSQNLTLLDAFKMIDKDEDQMVSLREFQNMFDQMEGTNIPPDAIKDLFTQMDKDRNGTITYNEMLNYLREAKQEEEKLKKMKFIQERTQMLREQTVNDSNLLDIGQNAVMTVESRLQMKIAILEMREKNATQRAQTLIQTLSYQETSNKDLNKQIQDIQTQMEKSNETFYREREENLRLKERVQGAITREESEKLKRLNEMFKLQIVDLNSALSTYRNLYDTAVTQTKIMRMTIEKIRNDEETMLATIKELQAGSDPNAVIGKLYHQVMISRWNEGQTNQKFEKILDELRRLKINEASFEAIMKDKQEEVTEQNTIFRDTLLTYERQITELKGKILPTVTLQRVEEQFNRIKEISDMKFEVEKQNRELREKFYELQLKADYFDIYKSKLDELEQRLKRQNTDELSQSIIEVSEKYSDCKIELLKALRDLSMAKEKEDYYQRLNRTYTDTIKKLEYDLANTDLALRKREEEWRKKFYEQRKTIFSQLGVQEGEKQQKEEKKTQERMTEFLQKKQDTQNTITIEGKVVGKSDGQGKVTINEIDFMSLKLQLEQYQSDIKKRDIDIEGLMQRLKNMPAGSIVFGQQQLESYTKDIFTQEAEKLSMAAQQTIRTLQDIIRDKEAQVERKEKQIETVKREAMMHSKRDLEQIQTLTDLLHQRNKDRMNDQIAVPPMQQSVQFQGPQPVSQIHFQTKLKEKDDVIKELEISFQAERKALKKLKDDFIKTLEEKEQLQNELVVEQRKNESEKYKKQVETLQKLVNSKNKEFQGLKSTVTQLKEEVFKVSSDGVKKETELQAKQTSLVSNNTELEMRMRGMLNDIKQLKQDLKLKHDELDQIRMKEIEMKAKHTDILKQNQELKAVIVQGGGKVPKDSQGDVGMDDQVTNISTKLQQLNQLQIENATLQKEIQFLKTQGQGKNLFDKEGNLMSQNNQIYFKNVDELIEVLRAYLQSKPRVKLLQELERVDKQKTRFLPLPKFFEILGMVGIKFKTRDQKLLIDFVKTEKGENADYYYKFYYKIKDWQDFSSSPGIY